MCAATARPPRPARGPTRDPRSPPSRLRYVHSPAAGDSAAVAKYVADEAATADELPALLDGSSDEDEPGKPDFFVASLGKPDFFVTLIVTDEFSCTRRQDVMRMPPPLRHLTLETQSRGKLHPHGLLYVAHSRVKNVASVHTYVAMQVCGQGPDGCRRLGTTRRNINSRLNEALSTVPRTASRLNLPKAVRSCTSLLT